MSQNILYMGSPLNMSESIREDDIHHCNEEVKGDDDSDLLFGSLDDEQSSSTDEKIHLQSNDTNSIAPVSDANQSSECVHQRTSLTKEQIVEQFIGIANFRAKHRRSSAGLTGNWKDAAKKAGNLVDPWLDFKIDQYPEEIVICHDYDPIKHIWNKNEIIIKIEPTPFGNGSMRECFRLKKLAASSSNRDWDCASNYIAKQYIIDVPDIHYFNDVMMQMTTKLWAAHYNQYKPPKKIDIIQMSVLEFKNRADRRYYHLEGFIEGTYIKYNSNSGFVCDSILRHTPQAFSHFTFEASFHQLIVVDIQGVGDLYTDPQIHTSLGIEYGEGNLGIRGMALFFYTHKCNPICTRLNLTPFDLSAMELERQAQQHLLSPTYGSSSLASTACRGSEEPLSPFSKVGSFFRRNLCQSSEYGSDGYVSKTSSSPLSLSTSHVLHRSVSIPHAEHSSTTSYEGNNSLSSSMTKNIFTLPPHVYSHSQSEISSKVGEIYETQNSYNYENDHRPSSVVLEKAIIEELDQKHDSIVGQVFFPIIRTTIHLEICKCYQVLRFNELGAEEYDEASSFFHLQQAAELHVKDALLALAKVYLDLPRELLANYSPMDETDSFTKGLRLMLCASELQLTEANLLLAQLYDTGVDGSLEPDWKKAAEYYEKYICIREMETNNIDENADANGINPDDSAHNVMPFNDQHDIIARLATLYKTGDHNLECNYRRAGDLFNKAAEMATAVMKGRLANKYYQAAEEVYALEPDEEE